MLGGGREEVDYGIGGNGEDCEDRGVVAPQDGEVEFGVGTCWGWDVVDMGVVLNVGFIV